VRGARREDFENARFDVSTEGADQVAALGGEVVAHLQGAPEVVFRGGPERVGRADARQLRATERDATVEVPFRLLHENRRAEHLEKGRRESDRESRGDAVAMEIVEDEKQREIAIDERLEEPVFFEEVGMFGMVNPRQMPVEDDANRRLASVERHAIAASSGGFGGCFGGRAARRSRSGSPGSRRSNSTS
jgi:hypothetical protein